MTEYNSFSISSISMHDHTDRIVIVTNGRIFFISSDLWIAKFDEIFKKSITHKLNVKINLCKNKLADYTLLEMDNYTRLFLFASQFRDYLLLLSCESSSHQL